jgi:hypothetical protein
MTECGSEVSICRIHVLPTFPSIVTFHFTRPEYWDIKPISFTNSPPPAIQIVLGIVIGCVVCVPLITAIISVCCVYIHNIFTNKQRNVDQKQTTEQAKTDVSTPHNNKPSLSIISSVFEALPPPYDIVNDNHHAEVSPPSYSIAIIHLQSSDQSQSSDTIIPIKD